MLCHSGIILRSCVVSVYEKLKFEPTLTKERYSSKKKLAFSLRLI